MKRIYTFLLLSFVFCTAIMSQNFIIKGVAKSNAAKEPMPGVHVAILSEKVETTTNEYGEFELKVLQKGQMVLTFFGGNVSCWNLQSVLFLAAALSVPDAL